jgi:VIT1/CCC1 family predicted Fe2+/Mn2+ transporter
MKHSIQVGLSFGLTSGIITTLGLMVGLHAGTNSKLAVLGGIITIAVADAFSDAVGIHVSEESENKHTQREIWESTLSTFLFKFVFASTFIIPVMLFPLSQAIIISIAWGLFALSVLNFVIATEQHVNPWKMIAEHLIIAILVIAITHSVGDWIYSTFG